MAFVHIREYNRKAKKRKNQQQQIKTSDLITVRAEKRHNHS